MYLFPCTSEMSKQTFWQQQTPARSGRSSPRIIFAKFPRKPSSCSGGGSAGGHTANPAQTNCAYAHVLRFPLFAALIIAHCNRRYYDEFRKLLRTRSGLLYTAAFFLCAAMVGTVYSLDGLATTQAIPLLLVVLPILGSLSLVMPQVWTILR